MSGREARTVPVATQELRHRWVNDIAGTAGSLALFIANVSLHADTPTGVNMGVSGLCLIAAANFAGGAFDKGRQLTERREQG